jgi:ABC-type dipeptide/oligopeptide/nickel transport system ATPase component
MNRLAMHTTCVLVHTTSIPRDLHQNRRNLGCLGITHDLGVLDMIIEHITVM